MMAMQLMNKGEIYHPCYKGLNLQGVVLADSFYEKIKDKPVEVLERYLSRTSQKDFWDGLSLMFDTLRQARRKAVYRVLFDREVIENAESEAKGLTGFVGIINNQSATGGNK